MGAFQKWSISVLNILQRSFGEDSVHFQKFEKTHSEAVGKNERYASEGDFRGCRGIFLAAKDDYENGYLFNVRALIHAEVFSDTLEQARELSNKNYKDPACILAGTTLELALKDLCKRNNLPEGTINPMNDALAEAGIYNLAMKQQITAWAALRNAAAHGKYNEYSETQVSDLIRGVTSFVAEKL